MAFTTDLRQPVLKKLQGFSGSVPSALIGFDGFIDEICELVDQRISPTEYRQLETIPQYAERILRAAGKSTNFEVILKHRKLGGNCPLMADALGRLGTPLVTCGAFGYPEVDPLFAGLAKYGPSTTITNPGITVAYEFADGKIMNGRLESLAVITPERILEQFGGREGLIAELRKHALIGAVNWTMIPHLTAVFALLADVMRSIPEKRMIFVDLCDPVKRPLPELRHAMEILATLEAAGHHFILGLNEQESEEICRALGIETGGASEEEIMERAERIRQTLGNSEVVIHPVKFAATASKEHGMACTPGPVCPKPLITTGAGDHFNGGYCFGRLMGLTPSEALITGVCTSGYYVRNAHGPTPKTMATFVENWLAGKLD